MDSHHVDLKQTINLPRIQRQDFRRPGVFGRKNAPYLAMSALRQTILAKSSAFALSGPDRIQEDGTVRVDRVR